MRFVLSLDDDLEPFHRAYRSDPLLGRVIRARPKLRVLRKPEPFEALAWAVIEQLIDTQAAGNIAWTLTRRHGERHPSGAVVRPHAREARQRRRARGRRPRPHAVAHALAGREGRQRRQIDPADDDQRKLARDPAASASGRSRT